MPESSLSQALFGCSFVLFAVIVVLKSADMRCEVVFIYENYKVVGPGHHLWLSTKWCGRL